MDAQSNPQKSTVSPQTPPKTPLSKGTQTSQSKGAESKQKQRAQVDPEALWFCARCGVLPVASVKVLPTQKGIRYQCRKCKSFVREIDSDTVGLLPQGPQDEEVKNQSLMTQDDAGSILKNSEDELPDVLLTDSPQLHRLSEALDLVSTPRKTRAFVLRLVKNVPSYLTWDGLYGLLMGIQGFNGHKSKIVADFVSAQASSTPGSHPGSPPAQGAGYPAPEDSMEDEIMRAVILRRKLDILGVNAQGQSLQAAGQSSMSPDFENGMKMAMALLGKGQDIKEKVMELKALKELVGVSPVDAEVAGIMGTIEIEKMKREDAKELALAKQADEREASARTQETINSAVKTGLEVVKEIAEPLGATLAGGVKNMQQGQAQGQPTPADQLSPEDRAEILQRIEQARTQLDAREREVQSMDAPSVEVQKVEVMREKDGGHVDVHEGGG